MAKKEKKSGFFQDFKKFITKGNILDMAVGMIIGAAFNGIVKSLVDDIIMPCIGKLCNTQDLSDLKYVLTEAAKDKATGELIEGTEVAIRYGAFLNLVLNFFIVALTLFVIIRAAMKFQQKMESLRKKEEEEAIEAAPPAPAEPTVEEKTLAVLGEIKDLLNEKK